MTRIAKTLAVIAVGSLALLAPAQINVALAIDVPGDSQTFIDEVDAALAKARGYIDQVEAVEGKHTIENTLVPLNEAYIHVERASNLSQLVENVFPSEPMREAAEKAYQRVDEFNTALSLNRNVYDAVADVDVSAADPLTQRLAERTLRDYRRAGVDRDEATREKVKALQEEITKIGQEFDKNIRDGQRFVEIDSADELAGLPPDYIDSHQPGENGKIKITTDYPDCLPVFRYAENAEFRKALYYEFRNRAYPENREVLLTLVAKRDELAKTLGYKNWAEYITEDKMSKSPKTVIDFIARLDEVTRRPAARDLAMLVEVKKQDFPDATDIGSWEATYYINKLKKEEYDFDPQALREYYNYTSVKEGILSLNETLFEIDIRELPDAEVWHPSVDAYEIYDNGELLGQFYLDMHPRDGKYGHAAAFPLISGLADRQVPQASLVCNFPEPDENGVGLMEHSQVETFLHEFGHLIHIMFSGDQRWIAQSGFATEWDFVEAPSQMLEEWAVDASTLQRFARHYETDEPIPADLIAKLRASREFGEALSIRRQNALTAVSLLTYESDPTKLDPDILVPEMFEKYSSYTSQPGTHMYANFGHLNGYSAIYYTYMWSLVIAKDMFSRFNEEDLLNSDISMEYRAKVLAPGGQKDAADLVEDFLGRPYGFESFALWLEGNQPN